MVTKLAQLKDAYTSGQPIEALRIAARFPRLGAETAAITRAWAAHQNPNFYRQIGHDPQQLVTIGLDAIRAKYRL